MKQVIICIVLTACFSLISVSCAEGPQTPEIHSPPTETPPPSTPETSDQTSQKTVEPDILYDVLGIVYLADGYDVECVAPAALGLPMQMSLLPDGTIVHTDYSFQSIRLISTNGDVSTLVAGGDLRASAVATYTDGRVCYTLHDGQLFLIDPESGEKELLGSTPPGDVAQVLAADDRGNVYAATLQRNLYRFAPDGSRTTIAIDLPFNEGWHITDMDVSANGTIYVTGNLLFISISDDGNIVIIADDVHDEPVWCEVAPDGNVYFKDSASGVRRYNPTTCMITLVEIYYDTGIGDLLAISNDELVFLPWGGDLIYSYNLTTEQATPIFTQTVRSRAFAVSNDGAAFLASPSLYDGISGYVLQSHIVRIEADGSTQSITELTFNEIAAADLGGENCLNIWADNGLYKYSADGEITSVTPLSSHEDLCSANMAVSPSGLWYFISSDFNSLIQVGTIDEKGKVIFLPIIFNLASFVDAYQLRDARIDVGSDGRLAFIVTAQLSKTLGGFYQRVYQANSDGTNLTEIANFDCERVGGMVDIAMDNNNNIFVLVCLGKTGVGEAIYRIGNNMEISKLIEIRGGRDPESIDVDSEGNVWFCTAVGVFRLIHSE
ncbi:hypothetical protein ES708_03076 [subsurface metagenome]